MMSNIDKIKDILGSKTPANMNYADELKNGNIEVPFKTKVGSWDRFAEVRNLNREFRPLIDQGWDIQDGASKFREQPNSLLLIPPVTAANVDTATLSLRDRVRVEGKVKNRKFASTDWVDALPVDEATGTVVFDSITSKKSDIREIESTVEELERAGWRGEISRRVGVDGFKATLRAPASGMKVKPERIAAFVGSGAA